MNKILLFIICILNGSALFSQELDILRDSRDNQEYVIVKIGSQWWMSENLNYKSEDSKIYNDSKSMAMEYGRLYSRHNLSELCPVGWHVPTESEWTILLKTTKAINQNQSGLKGLMENGRSGLDLQLGGSWQKLYRDNYINLGVWGSYYSSSLDPNFESKQYVIYEFLRAENYPHDIRLSKGVSGMMPSYLSVRCIKN